MNIPTETVVEMLKRLRLAARNSTDASLRRELEDIITLFEETVVSYGVI